MLFAKTFILEPNTVLQHLLQNDKIYNIYQNFCFSNIV